MAEEEKKGALPPESKDPKEGSKVPGQDGKAEGKKDSSKKHGKKDKHDRAPKKSKMNDVAWYVIDAQILKDVASLAFSNMLGLPVKLGNVPAKSVISQLVTVNYVPTIGKCSEPTSGYNLAVRNLYTVVRHKNSGHTNYESPDLGFYLFATTEVVCALLECERALSLANSYLIKNRNLPERVLSAMRFSLKDISANAAVYRGRINVMLSRVSSLCIPKDYKYFQRRIWMSANLFKDHKSTKGIAIAFKSQGIWKFDATGLSTGGCLQFWRWDRLDSDNMSERLDVIEDALDRITEDEDMNIMSGDILKAFGAENCQKYGFLGENTQLFPEFVEEMLPQIHNLVTLPSFNGQKTRVITIGDCATHADAQYMADSTADAWITQKDGYAIFEPVAGMETAISLTDDKRIVGGIPTTNVGGSIPNSTTRLFLNSYAETPTPEEVMLATRLRVNYSMSHTRIEKGDDVQNYFVPTLTSFGSEIVESFTIGILTDTGSGYTTNEYNSIGFLEEAYWNQASICQSLIQYGAQLAQIDWAPITYNFVINVVSGVVTNHTFFGDLDNYTLLDNDVLARMHESAVQAEFTSPVIASFGPKY